MRRAFFCLVAAMTLLGAALASPASADDHTGSIAGTVVDDSAAPIEGICVRAGSTGPEVATDANGIYQIDGLEPGEYAVYFRGCGESEFFVAGDYASGWAPTNVTVSAGAVTSNVDEVMRQGGMVSGVVSDINSAGFGVALIAERSDGFRVAGAAAVAETGQFETPAVAAGQYRVLVTTSTVPFEQGVYYQGGFDPSTAATVTVSAGQVLNLGSFAAGAFGDLVWPSDDDDPPPPPPVGGGGGGGAPAPPASAPGSGSGSDGDPVLSQLPPEAAELSPAGTIHRLYVALLGRVADEGGLAYWVALHEGGESLTSIARQIAMSAEFASNFGELDDAAFMTLLYEHVLGRDPDPSGLAYWVEILGTGQASRAHVILLFADSAEMVARIEAALGG